MLSERDYARRYWEPRYQAALSCTEREALMRWAAYARERDAACGNTQDCWLDPRRLEFARYLIRTGRISEWGVEGAGRREAPGPGRGEGT